MIYNLFDKRYTVSGVAICADTTIITLNKQVTDELHNSINKKMSKT